MQGMGWTCLEELVWGDEEHKWLPPGVLHTRGPGLHPSPSHARMRGQPHAFAHRPPSAALTAVAD